MEQNSSSVCVATIHKDDQKSTKLLDDAMPLYATIIPANTRKARWVSCLVNFVTLLTSF